MVNKYRKYKTPEYGESKIGEKYLNFVFLSSLFIGGYLFGRLDEKQGLTKEITKKLQEKLRATVNIDKVIDALSKN